MDVKRLDHAELQELITSGLWQTRRQTFDFFKKRLGELCQTELRRDHAKIDEKQLDYVSWVLTVFSMKSFDLGSWPIKSPPSKEAREIELLKKLYDVPSLSLPPQRCEKLGRIVMFVGSFEEDRLKQYYSDYWIVITGERLFLKAAVDPRTNLLLAISKNFSLWLNYLRALKHNLIRGNLIFKSPIITPKSPA